jgi:hypothetical protein
MKQLRSGAVSPFACRLGSHLVAFHQWFVRATYRIRVPIANVSDRESLRQRSRSASSPEFYMHNSAPAVSL